MTKTRLDYEDPMLLLEIEGLARDGFDDGQIAEIFNVVYQTFSKYKNKKKADGAKSDLYDALARGRRPLTVLVENAMYKRAIGQTVRTKTTVKRFLEMPDGTKTDTEIVQVTETETELPGDVLAQWNWLKNRKPDIYNVQPERYDVTTKGKELVEVPRIIKIEHVNIESDQVKKQDVEV